MPPFSFLDPYCKSTGSKDQIRGEVPIEKAFEDDYMLTRQGRKQTGCPKRPSKNISFADEGVYGTHIGRSGSSAANAMKNILKNGSFKVRKNLI